LFCFLSFLFFSFLLLFSAFSFSVLFFSAMFIFVEADDGGREEDCALRGKRGARHGDLRWISGYCGMVLSQGLVAHFGYRAGKTRISQIRSWCGFGVRKMKWMARARGTRGRGDEMTSFHRAVFCLIE
jgi:hypothetical protein